MKRLINGVFLLLILSSVFVVLSGQHPMQKSERSRKPAAYRYAYAYRGCAPWDGPAIRIVLQQQPPSLTPEKLPQESYPHYTVSLWMASPKVGQWYRFDAPHQSYRHGHLGTCPQRNHCKALGGRVRLEKMSEDKVSGELRVFMGDNTSREEVFPFEAPMMEVLIPCG